MQVFTEAEVRASLVFQLSKLSSLLLKASRLASGGAEWDALVAGKFTLKAALHWPFWHAYSWSLAQPRCLADPCNVWAWS